MLTLIFCVVLQKIKIQTFDFAIFTDKHIGYVSTLNLVKEGTYQNLKNSSRRFFIWRR